METVVLMTVKEEYSVEFVAEWMRFARTKYPAGARPLVVPDRH